MSERHLIKAEDFITKPLSLFDRQWVLLSAGDFAKNNFNCMTISWGSLGTMWNKPIAMVVVRPTRHTFHFMEKYPDFTLSAFPKAYQKDLAYLGSHSGRDGDKLAQTQLNAITSKEVCSPSFAQAELTIECWKIFASDYHPSQFIDPEIDKNYPEKDYHRIYFGEIVSILASDKYHQE